ncbi:hypothetical protein [Planomicrobium sp. Y74]|nr:hypothetical protein [Planomicrobium sp. Y74]
MTINLLEVFIENPPVESASQLEIKGIGNIKGTIDYLNDSLARISLQ